MLHEDSRAMLELLLTMLAKRGEPETNRFIREELLKSRIAYEKTSLDKITENL